MSRACIIPIGGAESKIRDRLILRRFVEICGGGKARIAVIPTASRAEKTGPRYGSVFEDLGVEAAATLPFQQRADCRREDLLAVLEQADGVFLTGGNQLRLTTTLGGTPVADLLRRRNLEDGLHVAGTSAGATFTSEHMITFGDEGPKPRSDMVTLVPGLTPRPGVRPGSALARADPRRHLQHQQPPREPPNGGPGPRAHQPLTTVRKSRQPRLRRCLARTSAAAAALLSVSLVPAAGCRRPLATSADVAVTIDGEKIHYRQFESYLRDQADWRDSPAADASLAADVQSRIFDQFVDGQLLIRLAIERGMSYDPAVRGEGMPADRPFGEPGEAERKALALLLRDLVDREWVEDEIAAYYEEHLEDFKQPEQVHLRQILVEDRSRAEAARQALAQGEDFAAVAARFSQGPKAGLGGDQGRLARDDLPTDFRQTIFALEPGEVSDILSAYYGFLIFQVVERFEAQTQPLEAVAEEIRQTLARRHLDELADKLLAEARERYNVEVFPDNFPFQYQGAYAK